MNEDIKVNVIFLFNIFGYSESIKFVTKKLNCSIEDAITIVDNCL